MMSSPVVGLAPDVVSAEAAQAARPARAGRIAWSVGIGVSAIVLLVLFVLPAVMLVLGAFRSAPPGQGGEWSLAGFVETYAEARTYLVAGNSLVLAVSTSVLSTAIGAFFAWVATRTRTPLRRIVTPVMLVGILLPQLYFGLAWVMLGNPQAGTLNVLARALLGEGATPFDVNSWAGLIVLQSLSFAPIAYVLLIGVFVRMDGALEEAARISGAGPVRTLFGTTLRVLTPALGGVLVLQTTGIFAAFELPLLFGTPAGISVFSTEVYRDIYVYLPSRYDKASALSLMLVALVALAVLLYSRVVGSKSYTTVTGKSFRPQPADYGRVQWLFCMAFVLFAVVSIVLPVAELVLGSFQPLFGVYRNYTLENYAKVFTDPAILGAIGNTVVLSVGGGFLAMLLATLLSYAAARRGRAVKGFVDILTWIPWAIPGIVLSLGMLWAYLSIPGLKSLYGTIWLLLIGLVVSTVPVSARTADGALAGLSLELEEAGRMSGASPSRVFGAIVAPIVAPSFFAGWALSAVFISGNLSFPILLASPDTQTIATLSYSMYMRGDSAVAAALFCVMGAGLVILYLLYLVAGAIIRRRLPAARKES